MKCLYFMPFDVIPAKPDLKSCSRKLLTIFNLLFFLEMIISTLKPETLGASPPFDFWELPGQQGLHGYGQVGCAGCLGGCGMLPGVSWGGLSRREVRSRADSIRGLLGLVLAWRTMEWKKGRHKEVVGMVSRGTRDPGEGDLQAEKWRHSVPRPRAGHAQGLSAGPRAGYPGQWSHWGLRLGGAEGPQQARGWEGWVQVQLVGHGEAHAASPGFMEGSDFQLMALSQWPAKLAGSTWPRRGCCCLR